MGSSQQAYIIDLIALKTCKALDEVLCRIFGNPQTSILGFGFQADVAMFNKECPAMTFFNNITDFVEVQDFYKLVHPDFADKGGFGLAAVCENLFFKKLCKKE